jgi:hypothetical protein
MSERPGDDPVLEQEGLEHTESDPDQEPPFRDEFDVEPETSEASE